jgi:hypothetical protein
MPGLQIGKAFDLACHAWKYSRTPARARADSGLTAKGWADDSINNPTHDGTI